MGVPEKLSALKVGGRVDRRFHVSCPKKGAFWGKLIKTKNCCLPENVTIEIRPPLSITRANTSCALCLLIKGVTLGILKNS